MDIHAAEVAALLEIPVNRVIGMADRGEIPGYRLVDGWATWDRREVQRFARDREDSQRQEQDAQFAPVGRGLPGQQPVVRRRSWV